MWPKNYSEYPEDRPLKKEQVEPGKGIVGCEMHEINGWGNSLHEPPRPPKRGTIATLLNYFFGEHR